MEANAIVYKLPGHQVDVKLRVFSQEIQCHSLMLKLGSAYFRTFLDSADNTPAPASATIKYQYGTVIRNLRAMNPIRNDSSRFPNPLFIQTISGILDPPGEPIIIFRSYEYIRVVFCDFSGSSKRMRANERGGVRDCSGRYGLVEDGEREERDVYYVDGGKGGEEGFVDEGCDFSSDAVRACAADYSRDFLGGHF